MLLDKPIEFLRSHPKLVVAQDFEVACQRFHVNRAEFFQGQRSLQEQEELWWFQLRVLHRNKPGIATVTVLNEESLNRLVDNALTCAEQSHPDPWFRFPIWSSSEGLRETTPKEPPVTFMQSSFGALADPSKPVLEKYEWWNIETQLLRRSEREVKRDFRSIGSQTWSMGNFQEVFWGESNRERRLRNFLATAALLESCEATPFVSSGAHSFSPRAMEPILESIGELFLAPKKEAVIAGAFSKEISLWDDGTHPQSFYFGAFDLDGIAAQKTALIEKGKAKGFLYDAYSGGRDNCRSTGNRLHDPRSTEAKLRPRRLSLSAGTTAASAFWKQNPRGFSVEAWNKLQIEKNGEVVGTAFGWLMENGNPTRPIKVEKFKISLLDFLKNVSGLGPDNQSFGSCDSPDVFVGGKNEN